ncbi:hypothetical protein GQ457_01G004690 [Hibiscus cannabinus]
METLANKISTHLENHINLDQNFVRLKRKLEELNGVKEDMGSSIRRLEMKPRKKLKTEVAVWLRNVERINGEVQNLEEQVRGSNILSRIGNKILETTKDVEDLFQKGKSLDGLDIDDARWIGQALSTTKLIGQVADELMSKVWAHLMDNGVPRIGVWGMGGVGKTTIMKLINNQLLKENAKFNIVIWITVSKETSIKILQNRIARAIDVSLPEDNDETKRAGIIYERMTQKEKVPSFSKLKALRDLDLSKTNIKSLPYGMNRLVNLRNLNLENIKNVTKIPNGILPNLSSLRHLDVGRTLVQGQVGAFRKLEYFSGRFYDVEELNKYVEALDEGPRRYNIFVGRESSAWNLKFYPNYIGLNGLEIIKTRRRRRDHDVNAADHMIKLPSDVDQLSVEDCEVSGILFSWFISMSHPSFSSLRQIDIYNCQKLKKLLSFDVLKELQKLQQINVSCCGAMEEIIASDSEEGIGTSIQFVLPEFYCLRLENLPELKSICSADGVMVCDSLEEIHINQCPKLKRMPFTLSQLLDNSEQSLRMIHIHPKELWESLEWDQPNAKSLLQPFLYDSDYDSDFHLLIETEDGSDQ